MLGNGGKARGRASGGSLGRCRGLASGLKVGLPGDFCRGRRKSVREAAFGAAARWDVIGAPIAVFGRRGPPVGIGFLPRNAGRWAIGGCCWDPVVSIGLW